jgi:uncharacterized surface protein with fasciclin (FAS1) repeats
MRLRIILTTGVATLALAACAQPTEDAATDTTATDTAMTEPMAGDTMAAGTNPTVGGAPMNASATIVTNASAAPNLSTLVAAVTQAGLVETLSGTGPFTVFAPTNDAFGKVPKATLDGLMAPAAKDDLTEVLTYHVVPGRLTAADIASQIQAGNGTATLKTVAGENLTATMDGDRVKIAGQGGSTAYVSTADVMQSNGVVHVIDGVLTPTL